jgi:tetratricopeptide (TPR) repeat protein
MGSFPTSIFISPPTSHRGARFYAFRPPVLYSPVAVARSAPSTLLSFIKLAKSARDLKRSCGWLAFFLVLVFLLSAPEAWAASSIAGKLTNLQGSVIVAPAGSKNWQPAKLNQDLFVGDAIKTGPDSKAAILCVDESQLKLNENTLLVLSDVAPSARLAWGEVTPAKAGETHNSRYKVLQGEIWLRNNLEKFPFAVETPAVTAAIRGTEFNLRVSGDGTSYLVLLVGSLQLTNDYGQVLLAPGEEGIARPGQAPTKRVIVQPADAVQWVLYYPGIISYRDIPLTSLPGESRIFPGAPGLTALIQQGESAYDQGRMEEAKQAAEAVLAKDPGNGRALTLLGWISLQRQAPEEAQAYFHKISRMDDRAVIGFALASYRLGNITGAYDLVRSAVQRVGATPLLRTMEGYFALMVGRVDEAKQDLEAAIRMQPQAVVLARSLLAQIYLVQDRKEAALSEASQALTKSSGSPMALFSLALVKMAQFELPEAIQYLEKALAADPDFIVAYVYLAKVWLGTEYLGRAQKTIQKALQLAPRDAQVLSLAAFIRLAYRDYSDAFQLWTRASRADPSFGEPHLGLAIYHFRYRDFRQGLAEMLTATLLEPRVSIYQSELGKALYQVHAFDKALEVMQYAKSLDPKDPTPHFYRGIALSDLNRPGEAIQEINKSIELNDNVAMFRSRSLLDQDQSVRNTSLARSYLQLGLQAWAFSKAVTAVNYHPYNSSAHLFLRDSYSTPDVFLTTGQLLTANNTERALFRLLAPANQNIFTNIPIEQLDYLGLSNDYTYMFEMPYARLVAEGGIGAWEGKKSFQIHHGQLYGGQPGAAFYGEARYIDSRANQKPSDTDFTVFNGTSNTYLLGGGGKWEPTVQGTLFGFYQYINQKQSDTSTLTQGVQIPQRNFNLFNEHQSLYELGYYYRFNPQVGTWAYFAHGMIPVHTVDSTLQNFTDFIFGFPIPITLKQLESHTFDTEFNNVQLQQNLILGPHNLIAGIDYFSGGNSQRTDLNTIATADLSAIQPGLSITEQTNQLTDFRPPFRAQSFYLMDYWRLRQNLVLELGVFNDFSKDVRNNFQETISTSLWSPRFGANYQFALKDTQNTLRLALERHLTTHQIFQPLLVTSEIAGFPWAIDVNTGSEVRQAGFAWETQWNPKTFTTLRLNALRVATPDFITDDSGVDRRVWHDWGRYQGSIALNRILTSSLGLSMGVQVKRVVPDLSFQTDFFPSILKDYSEVDSFIGLAYMSPQGWLARVKPLLVQQYLKNTGHRADAPFVIMDMALGREFPNKRGLALFEIQNLFNRQPFYSLEPVRSLEFPTQRRFVFRLALYF